MNPSEGENLPTIRKVFDPTSGLYVEKPCNPKFIKGPIPFDWMMRANALGGKVGAVGLALWFLAGITKSKRFKMTHEVEKLAAVDRKTVYRALGALEQAGLISLERFDGARPLVTILDVTRVEAGVH